MSSFYELSPIEEGDEDTTVLEEASDCSSSSKVESVDEEQMSRTREVKIRLGPIMDRMKNSLLKIQQLEESLNRQPTIGIEEQQLHTEEEDSSPSTCASSSSNNTTFRGRLRGRTIERVPRTEVGRVDCATSLIHVKSRQLLRSSMEMLKIKLHSLQHMEEQLRASEDRRQELQHIFLQASLDRPSRELAATRVRSQQLEDYVSRLEQERERLEEKCSQVDQLQGMVISLRDQVREMNKLRQQVDSSTSQLQLMENDLIQRQRKFQEKSIRCDDLECQVEQLTTLCDGMLKSMASLEERNEQLERELEETRRARTQDECHIADGPVKIREAASSSTPETDDSSTLDSSFHNDSMEEFENRPNENSDNLT